jgi:PAS domain S-box-containing protein
LTAWKERKATIRIVAVYALFGGLWILFSDTVMGFITRDPDLLGRISLFKGLAFILITALLLYLLINRHVRRISDVNNQLQTSMENLRTAHQKLQLADFSIRNVCDAVYWIALDGRITDCNQAACTMLGYDREELLAMSVTDLDPDYANEDSAADLERLKRTGTIKLVRSHRAKDGRSVAVEISSNYLNCHGKEYICAIARDVTERVRAERDASFFGTLIEFSRDPFYVLDPADGYRMVYANRAACEHYGVTLEQLQTMRIPDWDPAFDMACVDGLLEQMRTGKQARFETMHRVASGKLVPVELTSSYLIHDGREYTCGYFYDISERKAMEEALRESESRYRKLFLEFQALLDGIPDGLTLLTPDLKVLWANPAAARATGHNPTDLIGQHCYEVRHGIENSCEGCIVQDTFRTGEQRETLTMSSIGRSFELRSVPVRDEDGKVVKVIEIGRDITEQIAAEAERIELERKLLHAQKLESLGVLAGGIAHDFNNILTGITGNLSILRMQLPEGHKGFERIDRCEKAVSQATGLICQLLTFSRGGRPGDETDRSSPPDRKRRLVRPDRFQYCRGSDHSRRSLAGGGRRGSVRAGHQQSPHQCRPGHAPGRNGARLGGKPSSGPPGHVGEGAIRSNAGQRPGRGYYDGESGEDLRSLFHDQGNRNRTRPHLGLFHRTQAWRGHFLHLRTGKRDHLRNTPARKP